MKHSILLTFFLLLLSPLVFAQESPLLQGKVVQADLVSPVEGASVINLKTQRGTIVDKNGQFLLRAAAGDSLLVRSIGFKPFFYEVTPQSMAAGDIRIILEQDSVVLREVEVISLPTLEQLKRNFGKREGQQSNVRNPAYIPPPPPTGSPASSGSVGSPIGALYNLLSNEGKQLRQLEEFKAKQKQEQERKERERYNSFFIDNTGYEQ